MSFIVAIDGPAGSGKGTITKIVGKKLGLVNIDTGATFRCVALNMIQRDIKIEEEQKISDMLKDIKIEMYPSGKIFLNGEEVTNRIRENDVNNFVSPVSTLPVVRNKLLEVQRKIAEGKDVIMVNGEEVTNRIRENDVNNFVSPVSTLPVVRNKLLEVQRKIAEGKDVIMEGRDIGTVVFPNANVKIYLDATAEERAKRRILQNQEKGIESTYEEVLQGIKDRDKRDSTREIAPLKKADDAIYLDSTNLSIEGVVNRIVEIINKKNIIEK